MAVLSNYFGLVQAEWQAPASAVAVPGYNTLKTSPNSPEGVLLKVVSNMTQAIDAGGLLMVSRTTPGKWMFMVGKTLELALRKNKLGYFTELRKSIPCYRFTPVARMDGHYFNPPSWTNIKGGVLSPYLVDTKYFLDAEIVDLIAIATSASEGYGYSVPGAYIKAEGPTSGSLGPLMQTAITAVQYMASEVPMQGVFSGFMNGVKDHAISLVPDDLKPYYQGTYVSAMSTFSLKDTKPTITIPTFWESGLLAPLEIPALVQTNGTGIYGEWATTTAWGLIAPDGYVFTETDLLQLSTNAPGKYFVDNRYGFMGDQTVSPHTFPYMTKGMKFLSPQTQTPLGAGMMEGLNVGLIRDGHTLARTILSSTRYADQPSTSPTLGSYLSSLVDGGPIVDLRAMNYSTDATTAETAVLAELQRFQPRSNIFSGGTLTATIAAFSSAWDTAAKAAAQANS